MATSFMDYMDEGGCEHRWDPAKGDRCLDCGEAAEGLTLDLLEASRDVAAGKGALAQRQVWERELERLESLVERNRYQRETLRMMRRLDAEAGVEPSVERGAGIARLPMKPVVDYSGWVDEMDLLPDEEPS